MNRPRLFASLAAAALLAAVLFPTPAEAGGPYSYYSLTPCRVVDTRTGLGGYTGILTNGVAHNFTIKGNCSVPVDATAITVNATVADTQDSGWLALFPAGTAYPGVSNINFVAADTIANGAIVPLAATTPDLTALAAFALGGNGANLILDVTGYFK